MNLFTESGGRALRACGFLVAASMFAGCAQVKENLETARETVFPASSVEFLALEPNAPRPAPAADAKPRDKDKAAKVSPDLYCSIPQEEFEYAELIERRFGAEAQIRLTRLMATDFKRSDLTPQEKEMLDVLARETLWIPAGLESLLGELLFRQDREKLKTVPKEGPRGKYWMFSEELITQLLNVSPKTPFDTRLAILQSGNPRALAGGMIFIDQETVRTAYDGKTDAMRSMLTFVYAHELAHIFKRHKAKQMQRTLIETDDGLKIMRELMTGLDPSGEMSPVAWISGVFEKMTTARRVVELLASRKAEFSRAQEHEADSCATILMLTAGLGDPLAGFKTYAANQPKSDNPDAETPLSPHATHPPHADRAKVITQAKAKTGSRQK